jgi:ATP-binding cassette subfamily B protein
VEKYNTFLSAMVSAERIVGILDEKTEWESESKAAVSDAAFVRPAGIRFEKVNFHYPLRPLKALQDVSFAVEGGTSLAIVGATGSGKSTLIRLLLRFYEPQSGQIFLGEKPLDEWKKDDLRRHVGVVHQEIYLFQGTVRENLTLGQSGYSDSYLREQCERAQLWNFIEHRGGLDMPILEGGSGFSVGERQLLSFARILVSDPPVLVLDEATSSVDRRLERRLMGAIRETLLARTSIVIAHRLSTIRQCQRILVLEKATVVEEGTHDGLLRKNGLFAKFHHIHASS